MTSQTQAEALSALRDRFYRAETAEEFAEIARIEAEILGGPFFDGRATQITASRQIALQASYEMGREAAKQGADYFTGCKLTDHECRLRWADGHNSTREIVW